MRETIANKPSALDAATFDPDSSTSSTVTSAAAAAVGDAVDATIPAGAIAPSLATATAAAAASSSSSSTSSSGIKRPLTLDLNAKPSLGGVAKRQRFNSSVNAAPVSVLNSPDLQMLKMASPELEKFMTNTTLPTPTPSLVYPTKVTTEQEDYAKGFVDALNSLHNCETSQQQQQQSTEMSRSATAATLTDNSNAITTTGPKISAVFAVATAPGADSAEAAVTTAVVSAVANAPVMPISMGAKTIKTTSTMTSILSNAGLSGGTITYTNLETTAPSSAAAVVANDESGAAGATNAIPSVVSIKVEPASVSASPPPHSPIDMDEQERQKLDRKRQRNRVAASKCRKRKLERISKLEDKVKNLKSDNTDLAMLLRQLKENVSKLKEQVILHTRSGCKIKMDHAAAAAGGVEGTNGKAEK